MTVFSASIYGQSEGLLIVADNHVNVTDRQNNSSSHQFERKIIIVDELAIVGSGDGSIFRGFQRILDAQSKEHRGLTVYTAVRTIIQMIENNATNKKFVQAAAGTSIICGLVSGVPHIYIVFRFTQGEESNRSIRIFLRKVSSIVVGQDIILLDEDSGVYDHPDFFDRLLKRYAWDVSSPFGLCNFDRTCYDNVWSSCIRALLSSMRISPWCGGHISQIVMKMGKQLKIKDGPITPKMLSCLTGDDN